MAEQDDNESELTDSKSSFNHCLVVKESQTQDNLNSKSNHNINNCCTSSISKSSEDEPKCCTEENKSQDLEMSEAEAKNEAMKDVDDNEQRSIDKRTDNDDKSFSEDELSLANDCPSESILNHDHTLKTESLNDLSDSSFTFLDKDQVYITKSALNFRLIICMPIFYRMT